MSWNDQTPMVVSVSQDGTVAIPQTLAPVRHVSVPQDVTYAMEAMRSACANWTRPSPTQATTEATVCDVALSRHSDMMSGASIGVIGTVLAVAWIRLCRSTVRSTAINRFDDRLTYTLCAGLGAMTGLFLVGLDLAVAISPLGGPTFRMVEWGSAIIGALVLPAARWLCQSERRRAVAPVAGE